MALLLLRYTWEAGRKTKEMSGDEREAKTDEILPKHEKIRNENKKNQK
jgi:hypothetical protein